MTSVPDLLLAVLYTIVAAAALSVCAAKLLHRGRWRSPDSATNQPAAAPIAGSLLHQIRHYSHFYDYLTTVATRYKTFRLVGLLRDYVFTVDPANVEYMLQTNFSNFGKRWFSEIAEELLGEGIFVVDGEKWRQQRKIASLEFSTKALRNTSGPVFKKNASKLAGILSVAAENGEVVDLQEMFMRSTMDSIFKIAFGAELDCLGGSNEDGLRFAKAFNDNSELILWRFINPFWKIARYLKIGYEAAVIADIKVVDDFIYKLISNKMQQMENKEEHDGSEEREDILSRFLIHAQNDSDIMNLKYIRDIVLNFVIAGKDTTAGTLSWFLYMLCKHPSVQEKVAIEVRDATQSTVGSNLEEFAMGLTDAAITRMQYLHATLSETLRLYPAVPVDSKVCFSDDQFPDGFKVRKGDLVSYVPYAMGRMKRLWGEDAEIFRPERWLDENGAFVPENPFKFSAFQAGPRICLGKEFAYRQMKIFAAVVLRFFTFKLADVSKDANYKIMLTLHIDGGLPLQISHIQS